MASALPLKRTIESENSNGNQPKKGHWSAALTEALNDENVRVYKDDLCTIIQDKFPKVC